VLSTPAIAIGQPSTHKKHFLVNITAPSKVVIIPLQGFFCVRVKYPKLPNHKNVIVFRLYHVDSVGLMNNSQRIMLLPLLDFPYWMALEGMSTQKIMSKCDS
jgi:hypothetical protein